MLLTAPKLKVNFNPKGEFMGLSDNLKSLSYQVEQGAKRATHGTAHILLRATTGFFLGLVLALIFQELFQFGMLMLTFLTILFLAVIFKVLSKYSLIQILVFDVICFLTLTLLRMYVIIAPN